MTIDSEPGHLRQGKETHKRIQQEWHKNAEGSVESEKAITKPNGKRGRMDVFVASGEALVAVVEIKRSDWDAMTLIAVRKNVKRQASQIWDYIESQLGLGRDVSPGIITIVPRNTDRKQLIERLFNEEGISVVWEAEATAERTES